MDTTMEQQFELCGKAFSLEASGNLNSAIKGYQDALLLNRNNPAPYLYLGYALAKRGDANHSNQVYSLAADISPNTINAWRNEQVSSDIRERSKHADESLRKHFSELHRKVVNSYKAEFPDAMVDRIYEAIWCATHDSEINYNRADQNPHLFYVPDLEPAAVFNASDYEWCGKLETAFETIKYEFLSLWNDPEISGVPYIDSASQLDESWQPLIGSDNWTSLHLYKGTDSFQNIIDKVPNTHRALQDVPLLCTKGVPREIVFSVLKEQQHIPPHFGLANTDMTVHLPLLNLEDCAIKVCDGVYPWEEGKLFLFDDSFIHESWNKGADTRVNLLFAAWHPDLTEHERNAITRSFAERDAWNNSRKI